MGPRFGAALPDRLDLLPNFALNPHPIPDAIRTAITDQCGSRKNRALNDLLSRGALRFRGRSLLPLAESAEPLDGLIAAVRPLDRSVLPVQEPPGTGNTYMTARAILALVREGKRIAVSSNSHEAIRNVLLACTGNVFADLHLPNPEELLAQADLVTRIDRIVRRRNLS